jgi:hypothetical protein
VTSKLPPDEQALYPEASAALDELLAQWRALGVPAHGRTGLLLAAFVAVSMKERGMTLDAVIRDIIECLESMGNAAMN